VILTLRAVVLTGHVIIGAENENERPTCVQIWPA